jgi:hypothetical protein
MSAPVLFPWIDDSPENRLFALKWVGDGNKHEFHLPKRTSRSIDVVLAHCVEVKDTIEGEQRNFTTEVTNYLVARQFGETFSRRHESILPRRGHTVEERLFELSLSQRFLVTW